MKRKPEDIEQLEQKILQLKRDKALAKRDRDETDITRVSRIGFRIGAELLSAVIVGAAIGYLLDKLFATAPWLMVIFLFFGGAAGIFNVYRLAQKESEEK